MQASSLTGDLVVVIESDEWRYSDAGVCYMSLIGVGVPSGDRQDSGSVGCRVTLEERCLLARSNLIHTSTLCLTTDWV
jgi:hypothetical protein